MADDETKDAAGTGPPPGGYGAGEPDDPDRTLPPNPNAPPHAHPFRVGDNAGQYLILADLGVGGMGRVYLAQDTRLRRRVALKICLTVRDQDQANARFVREAQLGARLAHPNVCRVYHIEEIDGHIVLCMEYALGRTLKDVLQAEGRCDPYRAALIAGRVARVMAYVHRQGVIHRDLTPANIMLSDDDQPTVMDFGVAFDLQEPRPENGTGGVAGTPRYVSPEQAGREYDRLGPESDVYMLGVVLYELLAGAPPFTTGTPSDILVAHACQPPDPPSAVRPDLDPRFDAVVLRALAKPPADRWAGMAAFAAALADLETPPLPPPGLPAGHALPPEEGEVLLAARRLVERALASDGGEG